MDWGGGEIILFGGEVSGEWRIEFELCEENSEEIGEEKEKIERKIKINIWRNFIVKRII